MRVSVFGLGYVGCVTSTCRAEAGHDVVGVDVNQDKVDRNANIARLTGANRRYIDEEIPHIAAVMCEHVPSLLADCEVLVIGSAGEDAAHPLAEAGPDHVVIDLTRNTRRTSPSVSLEVATR